MRWEVLMRRLLLVIVIFCLVGTFAQACEEYEQEEKCYNEEEPVETEVEEEEETQEEPEIGFLNSKWFIILDRLIDRYPIIERIIERILQWIFNQLLGMEI